MSRHYIRLVTATLLASLLIASTPAPAAATRRAVEPPPAEQIEGRGWWEIAACIDCVAGSAAVTGAARWPE